MSIDFKLCCNFNFSISLLCKPFNSILKYIKIHSKKGGPYTINKNHNQEVNNILQARISAIFMTARSTSSSQLFGNTCLE